MQIHIQSPHFDAGDKLLSDTSDKLSKLEKLFDRIEKCNVILKLEKSKEKKKYVVEVRLAVPGDDLFASERAESFEKALDKVSDNLKKQIVKHKEKMKSF